MAGAAIAVARQFDAAPLVTELAKPFEHALSPHTLTSSRRQRVSMNYHNLTVIGLREELANRGLSGTGIKLKKDLIARLQQDDNDKADASSSVIKNKIRLWYWYPKLESET